MYYLHCFVTVYLFTKAYLPDVSVKALHVVKPLFADAALFPEVRRELMHPFPVRGKVGPVTEHFGTVGAGESPLTTHLKTSNFYFICLIRISNVRL